MTALPLANFLTDFWNHHLVDHDRQGVFLVLVGFVGSFAFIRMSTRMIRSRSRAGGRATSKARAASTSITSSSGSSR